jgi:hypothetical protein
MSSILVLGLEMFSPLSIPLPQCQSIIQLHYHAWRIRFSIFDYIFHVVLAVNDKVPCLCGDSNIKSVVKFSQLNHDNIRRKCTWT